MGHRLSKLSEQEVARTEKVIIGGKSLEFSPWTLAFRHVDESTPTGALYWGGGVVETGCHYVALAVGLKPRDLPVSASRLLGLKVCATTAQRVSEIFHTS